MLQLHQRFMKFSTTNFRKFFAELFRYYYTVIFPEISGKIRRKFPEISELPTLAIGSQVGDAIIVTFVIFTAIEVLMQFVCCINEIYYIYLWGVSGLVVRVSDS